MPAARPRLQELTNVQNVEGYEAFTVRRLRRAVYEKTIPHYKIAGRVMVDLNELDAYIAAQRVEAIAS